MLVQLEAERCAVVVDRGGARGNAYGTSDYWLLRLGRVLHAVQRPDGSWPTLHQLTPRQLQLIDGTLAGTLSALQQVPGTLETVTLPDM